MKSKGIRFGASGVFFGLVGVGLFWPSFGQVPDPALTITLTSSNYLLLTITNGVSTANYEVYRRPMFHPNFNWAEQIVGSQGQTNFLVPMGITNMGFFQATAGLDWDQDGVENWKDGDPIDTNVLALSVTIISPANGSNLQ